VILFKKSEKVVFELAIDLIRLNYKVYISGEETSGFFLQEKSLHRIDG